VPRSSLAVQNDRKPGGVVGVATEPLRSGTLARTATRVVAGSELPEKTKRR